MTTETAKQLIQQAIDAVAAMSKIAAEIESAAAEVQSVAGFATTYLQQSLAQLDVPVPDPEPDPEPDPDPQPDPDPTPDPEPDPDPTPDPTPPPIPVPGGPLEFGVGVAYSSEHRTLTRTTTNLIYVASDGSDSGGGTSSSPFATLAKAESYMRANGISRVQILRGRVPGTRWRLGSVDQTAPIIIEGLPGAEIVNLQLTASLNPGGNLLLRGLKLTNLEVAHSGDNMTIEDCDISGASIESRETPTSYWGSLALRWCTGHDNWRPATKAQGLFTFHITKLLMEYCWFDHNGWEPGKDRASARPIDYEKARSHNAYLQNPATKAIVRYCLSTRPASHGIYQRMGGECDHNIVIGAPLGIGLGYKEGQKAFPSTTAHAHDNLIICADDISPTSSRGVAFMLANLDDCLIENNVIADYRGGVANATIYYLDTEPNRPLKVMSVNNRIYNWKADPRNMPFMKRGTGPASSSSIGDAIKNITYAAPDVIQQLADGSRIDAWRSSPPFSTVAEFQTLYETLLWAVEGGA